jgi:hypothetical protein
MFPYRYGDVGNYSELPSPTALLTISIVSLALARALRAPSASIESRYASPCFMISRYRVLMGSRCATRTSATCCFNCLMVMSGQLWCKFLTIVSGLDSFASKAERMFMRLDTPGRASRSYWIPGMESDRAVRTLARMSSAVSVINIRERGCGFDFDIFDVGFVKDMIRCVREVRVSGSTKCCPYAWLKLVTHSRANSRCCC